MSNNTSEQSDTTKDESASIQADEQNVKSFDEIFSAKLENYVNEFEQHGRMPPSDMYTTVLRFIQHKNVDSLVEGNYLAAARYENLLNKYLTRNNVNNAKAKQENDEYLLNLEINQLKSKLADIQTEFKKKIDQEKDHDTKTIANLKQKHAFQLKEFEKFWNEDENIRPYVKSSARLNNMRAQLKNLTLTKDFDKAVELDKEIKSLEKIESAQAQTVLNGIIEKKKATLLQAQQDELIRARQFSIKAVEEINAKHNKIIEHIMARITKLRQDKADNRAKDPMRGIHISTEDSYSPRSKSIMNNYKRNSVPKRLSLKPLCPAIIVPFSKRSHSRMK